MTETETRLQVPLTDLRVSGAAVLPGLLLVLAKGRAIPYAVMAAQRQHGADQPTLVLSPAEVARLGRGETLRFEGLPGLGAVVLERNPG